METADAIRILTDEALLRGADANDTQGIVRSLVTAHGLSFNAWFCVCCELADRKARAEGFKDQFDKATSSPAFRESLAAYHGKQRLG